jgi:CRISPR type III-B/RAMP module RAMP protein Cmr6
MSERYNLPADTAVLVNDHIARCQNLSLILDKYPPERVVSESKHKGPWLQDLIRGNHIDTALAEAVYQRWYAMIDALGALSFEAALDWRMVMGLGGESVLETALTLHRLYGLPFIPASALKGLSRAYLTGEIEQYMSKGEEDDHEDILRIFGSQKHAGSVLFFDALPTQGKVAFALDIMNPHYPEYYGGKDKLPTNDQNPIPVTFLTVAHTSFTFALAPRNADKPEHVKDAEDVREWLLEALQTYGVGGKTSAGYGYFKKAQPAQAEAQSSTTQDQPARPTERIRPPIPHFRAGQELTGSVVAPTDAQQRSAPAEARAFLRYQSFALTDVLLVVTAEEAQNWKPGETRICVFQYEEEREGCSILVCQPRAKKEKKKS